MPFHAHGTQSNDNGSFRSISDFTPDMEEAAVKVVLRNCKDAEEARRALSILGLTGTAEGMLAARDARAASPPVPGPSTA